MKNKILLTLAITLLIVTVISGQSYNASKKSRDNSSTTLLDSAGVFTGTAEELRGYSSLSFTVRSDKAGTYKVLFGNTNTITVANAIKTVSFSYTANDTTHTKYLQADGPFFKVIFTNSDTVAQTKFSFITQVYQGHVLPTNSDAEIMTNDAIANLSLDNIEADADSTVDMVTEINANTDGIEAKLDIANTSLDNIEADIDLVPPLLDSLEVDIESVETALHADLLALGIKIDSVDASSQRNEAKLDLLNTSTDNIESDADAIRVATELIDNAISGSEMQVDIVAELPAGTQNIGDVDIASISGNGTFGGGNLSVTTAVPLSANQACKKVTITNFTAGEFLYVMDVTATTSNGFPLGYLDSKTITVSNLNLVYVVSDGTTVDVRFTYEN